MKDELKIIPLGDAVAKMKTGSTPPTSHAGYFGGDIPWFTPGDIGSTKNLVESTRTLTQEAISEGEAKLFEKGMLLVTCIGDIGRVGILQQPSYSNQQITALKFKDDIDSDFAYYWFVSNKQKLVNLANQAIVPILNNERLSEIEFAYPPLTEQKRIASLLARADRLRQLRRTAHDLGDALLQSVFLEMFGDPIENTNHWEMVELSDVAKKITDGEHLTPKTLPTGLPIVMAQQVEASGVNLADCKFVSEEDFKKFTRKCKPEFGDLLLVSRGATIGRSCVVNTHEPFCLMGSVILIKPDGQKINSKFLGQIFKNSKFQDYIRETSSASAQQAIYVAPVAERKIILPPLSLQEEFAGVVARVESLRGRMGESERQVDGLFESLLSQSFSS